MRFLHLSDLHLGRRLYDVSLLEDQRAVLEQILDLVDRKGADGILLAGDLYDKPVPPAEAVTLLDWFLTQLARRTAPVFMVGGNHDSPERLAFGARLLRGQGVHIASVFQGAQAPVELSDSHGPLRVYLLPFVKPVHVRRVYPEAQIETYTDAVRTVIEHWNPDPDCRNVLVAHQLVTGALRCESEALSIGGLDDVDAAVFQPFDYVALGHLHSPQFVGGGRIRYCGTPLAYSFSEAGQEKSVTWVDLGEKGQVTVTAEALTPVHPVRSLRGPFTALMEGASQDYLRLRLTDEDDVPNALSRLRTVYPNLLRLEYDNLRTRITQTAEPGETAPLSPLSLLEEFYRLRNNQPMSDDQRALAVDLMREIWEDTP